MKANTTLAFLVTTEPRFPIGTKYRPVGKDYTCTVADYLFTFQAGNRAQIKLEYFSTYTFGGQTMTARDAETTVASGIHNLSAKTLA